MAAITGSDTDVRFMCYAQTRTTTALHRATASTDTATINILLATVTTYAAFGEGTVD